MLNEIFRFPSQVTLFMSQIPFQRIWYLISLNTFFMVEFEFLCTDIENICCWKWQNEVEILSEKVSPSMKFNSDFQFIFLLLLLWEEILRLLLHSNNLVTILSFPSSTLLTQHSTWFFWTRPFTCWKGFVDILSKTKSWDKTFASLPI